METTIPKESRLNIRCDSHTRQLLDKAARPLDASINAAISNAGVVLWMAICQIT